MTPVSLAYLHLFIAIIFEIIATSLLQRSEQFTRLMPSAFTILFYAGAFYFLSLSLRVMPVGVAYAIWSGVGIVLISLIGWVVFKQKLDLAAMIGIGFIVVGVLIVNLFSKSVGH
ncbi:SMR family transporter [Alcaligenes phenolicus]|uniref:SMR family transporter n=1 Tax=Alcaligenes phenolicus TaxID=232846 RepID=A0AAW5VTA7_9BURK|nr:SMR family transporter [Alcaligenes phenolicus]MCX5567205.1 SMR family transporter [Alcaligenes phenolicus]